MSGGAAERTGARLVPGGEPGVMRLEGELSFATVPELWRATPFPPAGEGPVVLDLGGVRRADSAGLALLVEWLRAARRAGRELRLRAMPEQMRAIARVSGLDRILPLEGAP